MNRAEKGTCGKPSTRYPELDLKCCVAYLPKEMRGQDVLGIPIRGAESPHRHFDLIVLNDGTLLSYGWRGKKESWGWMPKGRGAMVHCTQEEWEKALSEVGRRPKKEVE
jgi:hypothetical protein